MFFALALLGTADALADHEIRIVQEAHPEVGLVHFESRRSPIRLGHVLGTTPGPHGVTIHSETLCTTPCSVELPVGFHKFHFQHRGRDYVHRIRVEEGEQTLTCRPRSASTYTAGFFLTAMIVTAPVGVPLLLHGGGACRPD